MRETISHHTVKRDGDRELRLLINATGGQIRFGADRTRQTPIVIQTFDVVVTADELLLRQPCRRPYTYSGCTPRSQVDPELLCTRSDVHVKVWAVGD